MSHVSPGAEEGGCVTCLLCTRRSMLCHMFLLGLKKAVVSHVSCVVGEASSVTRLLGAPKEPWETESACSRRCFLAQCFGSSSVLALVVLGCIARSNTGYNVFRTVLHNLFLLLLVIRRLCRCCSEGSHAEQCCTTRSSYIFSRSKASETHSGCSMFGKATKTDCCAADPGTKSGEEKQEEFTG